MAVNGPLLQHADTLIKKAIKDMFKDSKNVNNRAGHFVGRADNVVDFTVSISVDKFVKQVNQKPFLS